MNFLFLIIFDTIPERGTHFHYKEEDLEQEFLCYILEAHRCRVNLQWEDVNTHLGLNILNTLDLIWENTNPNIEDLSLTIPLKELYDTCRKQNDCSKKEIV